MGLQQFEQRLERLVEGAFAKAFRGELQPVELGRRLTREMDLLRAVSIRGLIAPNVFRIELSREDYERFGGFVDVLERELADAARDHARSEGYLFLGQVSVEITPSDEVAKSTFVISGEVVETEDDTVGWMVLPDGRRVAVTGEPLLIGRLPECGVALADPNVSRRHAQVQREGDAVVLTDLGSTNGTRVNGAPTRRHRLADGDVITVGVTSLRFEAN
ncbi:MAG TPA: DUF3662 and FHA domain-containing protein [Acidimicrobiales bacterium]|jgi:hypothetical protein|nr:DUF3662 and FHA domain-containing protein [Acidimicrobiales bacterium]